MQVRSSIRQSEILTAARRLLLERGFDGMTVAMVAEKAGASVGSVTYFFKTKEGIAAAVAVEVIDAIAMHAQAALRGGGRNVEQSVRSLVAAALAWPKKFPRYQELAAYAMPRSTKGTHSIRRGMQPRLETVLADWARPLILDGSVAALSSAELFALVLAPTMCDTSGPVVQFPMGAAHDWADRVGSAAIRAIQPAKPKVGKAPKPPTTSAPPDLFGNVLDRQRPPRK
jgi:AcrR family transcriptional regulator